jgi:hypothetical protein
MLERDPLAAEFAALRSAVLIRPPGPAAAARTVRRRRRRTAVVTSSLVVALIAVLSVAAAGLAAGPHRVTPAWPSPSLGAPDTTTPRMDTTAGPSHASPSVRRLTPTPGSGASGSCHRYGAVQLDAPALTTVSVKVDPQGPYPLCPGERVRVFVATYSIENSAGVQTLYRSQTAYLDAAHNPLTLTYQVPPCHAGIYVVSGNQPIHPTIPAMEDFAGQAPSAYATPAAGPYNGVVWVQEQDPCAGTHKPAIPSPN